MNHCYIYISERGTDQGNTARDSSQQVTEGGTGEYSTAGVGVCSPPFTP